jgi:uncharacterized protein (TIGR04255 family)
VAVVFLRCVWSSAFFCSRCSVSALASLRFSPPPELPEDPVTFRHPPVREVALAVQVDGPIVDLDVLAELLPRIRSELPRREQQPALPSMIEDFSRPPRISSFQVEFVRQFSLPRSWFISQDNTRLLQIQADRFVYNWRKQEPSEEYPRYRPLREQFAVHLQQVWTALEEAGKQLPAINFCEVSYINQIEAPDAAPGATHPYLGDILTPIRQWPVDQFLPVPEDINFQARFLIRSGELESPVGRLYATASPTFRPDGTPIYLMTLVSRMIPASDSEDMAAVWAALDVGRDWIVRGFEQLTTDEYHGYWNEAEG